MLRVYTLFITVWQGVPSKCGWINVYLGLPHEPYSRKFLKYKAKIVCRCMCVCALIHMHACSHVDVHVCIREGGEYSLGIALAMLYCIFPGESGSSAPPVTHLLEPMDRFSEVKDLR